MSYPRRSSISRYCVTMSTMVRVMWVNWDNKKGQSMKEIASKCYSCRLFATSYRKKEYLLSEV